MHRRLLHNGMLHETSEPLVSPGQTGFMNGWGVFSTIRVYNGVLFAYQRHYERMKRDAQLIHVPFPLSAEELETELFKLIDANDAFNATLRVAIVRNYGGPYEGAGIRPKSDVVAFTTGLTDWGKGVKLFYYENGRHGGSPFAGCKVTSWCQNLTINEEAHEKGFDEAVLLNEHGHVSECTSANIFAVHGNQALTPPLKGSGCLGGITRAILLEEIHVPGVEILEQELTPQQLETADQVFITSTTRDLLPVFEIERRKLRQSREVLDNLQRAFHAYQLRYVDSHPRTQEALIN
jgi:branched-chain amino acid aminotransferase